MLNWTIVITVYQEYEMTRQLIESIWNYFPNVPIILVDDYSDPKGKLREYEKFLETKGVEVINHNEFRSLLWYQNKWMEAEREDEFFDYKKFTSEKKTDSHPVAAYEGLKRVISKYAFIIDMDSIVLEKAAGVLDELEELFIDNPKVMLIAERSYTKSLKTEVFRNEKELEMETVEGEERWGKGYINSAAAALNMEVFKKYKLGFVRSDYKERIMGGRKVTGVLFACIQRNIMKAGLSVAQYSFYGAKRFFHLGRSVIKKDADVTYGFCNDFSAPYGARRSLNSLVGWHGGRYYIDMTTKEYQEWLKKKYDKPFEEIQPIIDEKLLKPVDDGEIK